MINTLPHRGSSGLQRRCIISARPLQASLPREGDNGSVAGRMRQIWREHYTTAEVGQSTTQGLNATRSSSQGTATPRRATPPRFPYWRPAEGDTHTALKLQVSDTPMTRLPSYGLHRHSPARRGAALQEATQPPYELPPLLQEEYKQTLLLICSPGRA